MKKYNRKILIILSLVFVLLIQNTLEIGFEISHCKAAQKKTEEKTVIKAGDKKSQNSKYNSYLTGKNEKLLFGFELADSDKVLSINVSKDNKYIVYRYGTNEKIELVYPKSKKNSWNNFVYSYYFRGGGAANAGMDNNYLTFQNGNYQYKVYQEYDSATESTDVGVIITNLKTKKETEITGNNKSIKGSLISLRDNKKVKQEN